VPARTGRSSPSFSRHVAPFEPLALALVVGAGSSARYQPVYPKNLVAFDF
jgi:hypothetical protein